MLPSTPASPLGLSWSTHPDGSLLRVDYTLTNTSELPLFVCDRLGLDAADPRLGSAGGLVVTNGAAPGTAELSCGSVPTDDERYYLRPPVFLALAAGESHAWQKAVPLPLAAWHDQGFVEPLRAAPSQVVLCVDWFAGEPTSWKELQASDGTTVRLPQGVQLQTRKGEAQGF